MSEADVSASDLVGGSDASALDLRCRYERIFFRGLFEWPIPYVSFTVFVTLLVCAT